MDLKRSFLSAVCDRVLWLADGRGWFDRSAEDDLASVTHSTHNAAGVIGILGDLSVFHMETIVVLGAFHRRNLDSIANLHRFDSTDRHDCLGKNGVQFFKDRISVSVMVAALAAVAGVWLLSGGTDAAVGMKGLTLALATVATYAVYIVGVNKSCVQHMKGLKMVFFILLSATIIFAGNLFVKGEIPESIPDWSAAVHLILLALIPTLVSDLTLVLAVQRIGSTTTAILGCLEPLTAVALGIFFLGERFVAEQFAGVALIVAAVVTVILGGRPGRFSVRRLIPDFLSNFYKAR